MDCCLYRRKLRKIKEAKNQKHLAQQGVLNSVQKSLDNNGGAHRFGFNMAGGSAVGIGGRSKMGAI